MIALRWNCSVPSLIICPFIWMKKIIAAIDTLDNPATDKRNT